jgi:hypothetical protein
MNEREYRDLISKIKNIWMSGKLFVPPFIGCVEEELEELKLAQKVQYLPQVYRQFMLEMGRTSGGLHRVDGEFRYPFVKDFKPDGLPPIWLPEDFELPDDIFVFVTDKDAFALYFHTKAEEDDPIVYNVHHTGSDASGVAIMSYDKMSKFLHKWVEDLLQEDDRV